MLFNLLKLKLSLIPLLIFSAPLVIDAIAVRLNIYAYSKTIAFITGLNVRRNCINLHFRNHRKFVQLVVVKGKMDYNKYLPSIVTGFGAAVLSTIPGIKNLNCCLIIPAAAFLSIYLYSKSTGNDSPIKLNKALSYGLITGLVAAMFSSLFDILITYITHSNDLVVGLEQTEEMMQELKLGNL